MSCNKQPKLSAKALALAGLASALLFALAAPGCRPAASQADIAFYYWKSSFQLRPGEAAALRENEVQQLYIKYLDLDVEASGLARPVAAIRFEGEGWQAYQIIPCVFITNRTFQSEKIKPEALAKQVWDYLQQINTQYGINPQEYQFDCDWTASTREKYFAFLQHIRRLMGEAALSATIRLHQYRYPERTGLPPVDKGCLMYYNMGDIDDPQEPNSILNNDAGEAYLNAGSYPLELDVALPLFSWALLFRLGELAAIINLPAEHFLEEEARLEKKKPGLYEAKENFYFQGHYLNTGDRLRFESPTSAGLERAAEALRKIKHRSGKLIFYHLDEDLLQNYAPGLLRHLAGRLGT